MISSFILVETHDVAAKTRQTTAQQATSALNSRPIEANIAGAYVFLG
jgi:hypothetical protein